MGLFGKHREESSSYNPEEKKPVMKCSICNGEQVAGFLDKGTKEFEEVALIQNEKELEEFKETYGITEEIKKIY